MACNSATLDRLNKTHGHMQRDYGITQQEYDVMNTQQRGRCGICGKKPSGRNKRLSVDHCHTSGKVRGLLCHRCNTALGYFYDDPEIVAAAVRYITGP